MRFFSLFVVLFALSTTAFAGPELVCGSQNKNFRANFVAKMNRQLVASFPKVKWEASITGNTDGRPGTFDRIFTRAIVESSKEKIRIESLERSGSGDAVFVLDIAPSNMTGWFYSADASQGNGVSIPAQAPKDAILVRCFWRSHPDCNCGSPNGGSGCSTVGASGGVCKP